MAERPSFDMNRLSPADKILLGAGVLYFVDSFLPWQRTCAGLGMLGNCVNLSAWSRSASFLGVLSALFALAMIAWEVMAAAGVDLRISAPKSSISAVLVFGTFGFGLLKFLLSAFSHGTFGAWIGLILLLAVGYGGYMKKQEATVPRSTGTGGIG